MCYVPLSNKRPLQCRLLIGSNVLCSIKVGREILRISIKSRIDTISFFISLVYYWKGNMSFDMSYDLHGVSSTNNPTIFITYVVQRWDWTNEMVYPGRFIETLWKSVSHRSQLRRRIDIWARRNAKLRRTHAGLPQWIIMRGMTICYLSSISRSHFPFIISVLL